MADKRKLENIALALPVFGAALILPPIVSVFATDARVFGTPVIVVYLFSIWLLFIVATFVLSRRLRQNQPVENEASNPPGTGQDGPL